MNAVEQVAKQKTVFDLDTFEEVTLLKPWAFTPVADTAEALARVGNDSAKFLGIVNEGLRAEVARQISADPSGWHSQTDEGEMNGPFSGTIADPKAVNSIVLTMAKTVFGYNKDMTADQKSAAKASAKEFVKANETIRKGLQKSAALVSEE